MYIYIYMYTCRCVYTSIYIYKCLYIYIYILYVHIYIYMCPQRPFLMSREGSLNSYLMITYDPQVESIRSDMPSYDVFNWRPFGGHYLAGDSCPPASLRWFPIESQTHITFRAKISGTWSSVNPWLRKSFGSKTMSFRTSKQGTPKFTKRPFWFDSHWLETQGNDPSKGLVISSSRRHLGMCQLPSLASYLKHSTRLQKEPSKRAAHKRFFFI